MSKNIGIGTDVGGSHISCAAVDLSTGIIMRDTLSSRKVDTNEAAHKVIEGWAEALSESMSKLPADRIKGIGFAMPGPFNYLEGVCYIKGQSKFEQMYGMNVAEALRAKMNLQESFLLRFMNDACSFSVGEAWSGGAAKAGKSLSVTLGTGFGSGFVSDRLPVVNGPDVPPNGAVYPLPFKGEMVEEYISTRWFLRSYKKLTGKDAAGVKELAGMAPSDERVMALFSEFGENLGLFLSVWINKFRAEVLVLGGNISNAYHLFGPSLNKTLLDQNCRCEVTLSVLKEDAALTGSAYLLDDGFWDSVKHILPLM
jgi:glucokinase